MVSGHLEMNSGHLEINSVDLEMNSGHMLIVCEHLDQPCKLLYILPCNLITNLTVTVIITHNYTTNDPLITSSPPQSEPENLQVKYCMG